MIRSLADGRAVRWRRVGWIGRDPDLLTRGLAQDFPLHSMSELRRTIAEAQQDLWPHCDPIDILDRARERLHEGLIR